MKGSQPSPEAAKDVLLRRLTYDLTGLPPTPQEIDAFLADASPDAYEKQVDRLLRSPHYGERMAMPWLDAARYADTHGYHIDSLRDMWPWRDWVINAFNHNMPFDEFDDRAACRRSAAQRHPRAEDRDRVQPQPHDQLRRRARSPRSTRWNTSSIASRRPRHAFMGLTMGCARCHDHKFDPITQKEYYQFFAFFNTVPEAGWTDEPATPCRFCRCRRRSSRRSSTSSTAAIDTRPGGARRRRRRAAAARNGKRRCRRNRPSRM